MSTAEGNPEDGLPPGGATHPSVKWSPTIPPPGAAHQVALPAPAEGPILGPHHPNYAHCHGCGLAIDGGLRLRVVGLVEWGIEAELTVRDTHQGAPGLTHGGVLAAAMDEALSLALWRVFNRPYVTARLETSYLAPVPLGAVMRITANCTGLLGRKAYGEAWARLAGQNSSPLVHATGLFVEGAAT